MGWFNARTLGAAVALALCGCRPPPMGADSIGLRVPLGEVADLTEGELASRAERDAGADEMSDALFFIVELLKTQEIAGPFSDQLPPYTRAPDAADGRRIGELLGGASSSRRGLQLSTQAERASTQPRATASEGPLGIDPAYFEHLEWIVARLSLDIPATWSTRHTLSPLTATEARMMIRENEAVISLFTAASRAYAVVIRGEQVSLLQLGEQASIEAEAGRLRGLILDGASGWEQPADALCEQLLRPVDHLVAGADVLYVSEYQGLSGIPWTALCPSSGLLDDRFEVVSLPSLTTLRYTLSAETSTGAPEALVYGDPEPPSEIPRLPGARLESELVAGMFERARLEVERSATETHLKTHAPESTHIHLAMHGVTLPERYGVPPSLIMAPDATNDGFLTAAEVASLPLTSVDLVVLSACQSGLSTDGASGINSLSAAFLVAGAGGTVSTLWQVDDEATTRLMVDFYSRLSSSSASAALRAARKKLRSRAETSHPYYWAAFRYSGVA